MESKQVQYSIFQYKVDWYKLIFLFSQQRAATRSDSSALSMAGTQLSVRLQAFS